MPAGPLPMLAGAGARRGVSYLSVLSGRGRRRAETGGDGAFGRSGSSQAMVDLNRV